jgi:hypothetical protein
MGYGLDKREFDFWEELDERGFEFRDEIGIYLLPTVSRKLLGSTQPHMELPMKVSSFSNGMALYV